jgi:hypothetical protein
MVKVREESRVSFCCLLSVVFLMNLILALLITTGLLEGDCSIRKGLLLEWLGVYKLKGSCILEESCLSWKLPFEFCWFLNKIS